MLRKTEYSESSLVIATLTPAHGQQHFILKGVRKNQKTRFSVIDLFHHLDIEYNTAHRGDLNVPREAECIESHIAIASNTANFSTAIWLNQFVLKNTKANIPAPRLFQALNIAFGRLSSSKEFSEPPLLLSICFVTLMESGLLPEYSEQHKKHIGHLIDFALDAKAVIPEYSDAVWEDLSHWMKNFVLSHTDLVLPAGGGLDG